MQHTLLFLAFVYASLAQSTYTGYLVDLYCWNLPNHVALTGALLETAPGTHPVACMRDVPQCIAGGYALLENVGTSASPKYAIKYKLDTYGNSQVAVALKATSTTDQFMVTVTGSVDNTQTPPLFKVTTLSEDVAQVSYTGYLVDLYCWNLPNHVALTGALLETAPGTHPVACMRDVPQCIAGGYALLENVGTSASPKYAIKYTLDSVGNAQVATALKATSTTENFMVTVTGLLDNTRTPPVIDVNTLTEASVGGETVSYTGYLADNLCLHMPGGVAIDGAHMRTNPEAHTVGCMLLKDCLNSGFALLENTGSTSSPDYEIKYELDAQGNTMAVALLMGSTAHDDFMVTATGTINSATSPPTMMVSSILEFGATPGPMPGPDVGPMGSDKLTTGQYVGVSIAAAFGVLIVLTIAGVARASM